MKIKKEQIEKIILGILTFILILYIGFTLILFSFFHISEKFLNKENVHDFINNIDITNLLKDEVGNELKNFYLLKQDLNNVGVSTEEINEFINSEDVKDFSSNVVINVFNKVTNKSTLDYRITDKQLNKLIENNIDKFEVSSSIKKSQILDKLENKIPNFVSNINEMLDNLYNKLETSVIFQKSQNYIYNFINILDFVYNDFVIYIMIFFIISLIALLIFIRKNIYKSLKWISISFVIPTAVLGIISTFIFTYVNTENILINNIFGVINAELIKHSIIYFAISFIFVIINIIAYIIKKYRIKKKVSYE